MELTLNGLTDNSGWGRFAPENAILAVANSGRADGGYMFNNGVQVGTSFTEGVLFDDATHGICLTLCPRTGAGTSGEVILDSATELLGKEVGSVVLLLTLPPAHLRPLPAL